jgi:hypothetical protein
MTQVMWKPIRPKDWVQLEKVINEIWRLLNVNTSLSEINANILTVIADIATNASDIDALEAAVAGLDAVAGSDGQIQFNESDKHAADAELTFNPTTKTVTTRKLVVDRLLAGGVHE